MMKEQKIYRNEDGSRERLTLDLTVGYFREEFEFRIKSEKCEKGKRKWKPQINEFGYEWSSLDKDGQKELMKKKRGEILDERIMELKHIILNRLFMAEVK